MASKAQMVTNRNNRLYSGKFPETRSRSARNRKRNYIKEGDK